MVMSMISTAGWARVDIIAKSVFQFLGAVGFLLLAREVSRREPAAQPSHL